MEGFGADFLEDEKTGDSEKLDFDFGDSDSSSEGGFGSDGGFDFGDNDNSSSGGNSSNNGSIGGQGGQNEGGGSGGLFGDDNDIFGSGSGGEGGDYTFVGNKGAYKKGFEGEGEMVSSRPSKIGLIGSFTELFKINKGIYKELNAFQYIIISVFSLFMLFSIICLKEVIVFLIIYNSYLFDGLVGFDKLIVLILYFFLVRGILDFLDGRSKLLANVQLPLKLLLLVGGAFYFGGYIGFDGLFNIFTLGISPLVFCKLFTFNETDTAILDKIKNGASIEDAVVKNEINEIISKSSETAFQGDLPDEHDLLIGESLEQEDKYDLGSEMIKKNKEKNLTGFLLGDKQTIYFLDVTEEGMPQTA